jgi:hypothetical protein
MYTKNYRGKVLEAQRPSRHERNHQPVAIVDSASPPRPASLLFGGGHHPSSKIE